MTSPSLTAPVATLPSVPAVVPARAIVLLAVATFSATANLRVSDSLLPQVARQFSTSIGAAAVIITAFSLAFGCFQVCYGPVGDRLGKYRVIMVVCFVSALATGACAFMPTLKALAAGRFLSGVASAAIVPLAMAWVGDVIPYNQRQGILARFLTGQILGMACGQIAGGVLGDWIGWRSTYLVLGLVHLTAGLGLALEIWRNPGLHAAPSAQGPVSVAAILGSFGKVLSRPSARLILTAVFFEGLGMFGAFAYIGADLHHRFGLGFTALGFVLAGYGLGGMAYAWTARGLVARLGEAGLAGVGAALLAASYGALSLATGAGTAFAAILVMGFGFYMHHNTLQTNATQMAPEARGVGMSMFASCFFMGQSLGVALAALLIDWHGTVAVYLAAACELALVGGWLCRQLGRRQPARQV